MVEFRKSVRPAQASVARRSIQPGGGASVQKALELVAMRGREVIGVRQILIGGTAWVGEVRDALAHISMKDFGGQPLIVGAVTSEEFALYIPPRARAWLHGEGGVPGILVGPHKLTLTPGERAVLVLGEIQIRAQIVNADSFVGNVDMASLRLAA